MKTSNKPKNAQAYYEKQVEGWKHIPWEQLNKDAKEFWEKRFKEIYGT